MINYFLFIGRFVPHCIEKIGNTQNMVQCILANLLVRAELFLCLVFS